MRKHLLSSLEFIILTLCVALAACGGAWLIWEVVANAWSFNGYFANGAFQLLNPLRRVVDGQTYGRDFLNFHGIGTVWFHLPIYLAAGSDLRASEISRYLMSGLCHATAAVALTFAFRGAFETRKQAITFGLLFFASGALLFTRAYLPWNSILGVRSFFPLLLAAALTARRPLPWISLALGASLITSVEHGMAALLALFAATASSFAFMKLAGRRDPLIGGALLGFAIFAVVLFIATAGDVTTALRYALVDVPTDQFWYFGAPPNGFLPRDAAVLSLDPGFARFAATYILGCVATAYIVVRVRALTPIAVFLMVYATVGLVSQLGYIYSGNLHASERAIFALVLATFISAAGRRFLAIPAAVAGLYIAGWGYRDFKLLPITPAVQETTYLSPSWRNHVAAVERLSPGGAIWSVYAGLPEAVRGSFHPDFDYIIHALGLDYRKRYLETFLTVRPELVRLDPLWRWHYGGWLLMENWSFYREVFRRYEPAHIDQWGSLWLPAEPIAPAAQSRVPLSADAQGCYSVVPSEASIYSAEITYEVQNPWAWLPLVGKTPRLFLNISGAIDPTLRTVSLPDSQNYRGRFAFPLIIKAGEPTRICPEVASFFDDVMLDIKSLSVLREVLTQGARRYLLDRPTPKP